MERVRERGGREREGEGERERGREREREGERGREGGRVRDRCLYTLPALPLASSTHSAVPQLSITYVTVVLVGSLQYPSPAHHPAGEWL